MSDPEDRACGGLPQIDRPIVEAGVELRPHLVDDSKGEWRVRGREDLRGGRIEFAALTGLFVRDDPPRDPDDALAGQFRELLEERLVPLLLHRDLDRAVAEPDQDERDAPQGPDVLP